MSQCVGVSSVWVCGCVATIDRRRLTPAPAIGSISNFNPLAFLFHLSPHIYLDYPQKTCQLELMRSSQIALECQPITVELYLYSG